LALLLQCSLYYDLSKVESDEKKREISWFTWNFNSNS
jgi:hypothetical protein